MNQTLEAPSDAINASGLLVHSRCPCQQGLPPGVQVALCGTHILGILARGGLDCAVCIDLIEDPCPICGD